MAGWLYCWSWCWPAPPVGLSSRVWIGRKVSNGVSINWKNKTGGQQAKLQGQLQALEQDIRKQLKTGLDAANSASTNQSASLQQFSQQLNAQNKQIAAFSANDHESWLRAEAQYLLRLANQRVVMARDTDSALALLDSADGILRQLDDVSLHDVRAAVAAEQAALRAVPKVDVEGIYLRLSALGRAG